MLNLPATVEMATPNVYADQIEWFGRGARRAATQRHPQPAPAQRPRYGGRRRRAGRAWPAPTASRAACSATASAPATSAWSRSALNLFSQGIDPGIDFSDIDEVRRTVEHCNQLPVHPRHPYGGDLVYTAFSGSHQDAIKKGFEALERDAADAGVPVGDFRWEVPYLPIDPQGRRPQLRGRHPGQQPVRQGRRRLRAQERAPPRPAAADADRVLPRRAGGRRRRAAARSRRRSIWELFRATYLDARRAAASWSSLHESRRGEVDTIDGRGRAGTASRHAIHGEGNGPIAALRARARAARRRRAGARLPEHATGAGEEAQAASYLEVAVDGRVLWGCGVHPSIVTASLRAIVSAVNRG